MEISGDSKQSLARKPTRSKLRMGCSIYGASSSVDDRNTPIVSDSAFDELQRKTSHGRSRGRTELSLSSDPFYGLDSQRFTSVVHDPEKAEELCLSCSLLQEQSHNATGLQTDEKTGQSIADVDNWRVLTHPRVFWKRTHANHRKGSG